MLKKKNTQEDIIHCFKRFNPQINDCIVKKLPMLNINKNINNYI